MFYCNDCASENRWPITGFRSMGLCECCGKAASCNDRKSSLLPLPTRDATGPVHHVSKGRGHDEPQ